MVPLSPISTRRLSSTPIGVGVLDVRKADVTAQAVNTIWVNDSELSGDGPKNALTHHPSYWASAIFRDDLVARIVLTNRSPSPPGAEWGVSDKGPPAWLPTNRVTREVRANPLYLQGWWFCVITG